MKTFVKRISGYTLVTLFAVAGGILLIPAIAAVGCIYLGTKVKCRLLDKHYYDFTSLLRNINSDLVCGICNHVATDEEMAIFRIEPKLAPLFIMRDIAIEIDAEAKKQQENDSMLLQEEPIVAVQRSALEGQ